MALPPRLLVRCTALVALVAAVPGPAAAQTSVTPVVVGRASVAPVADRLVLSGTATARRTSPISPPADGLVATMLVDEGDHVDEGQVLAELDKVLAEHQLATAAAALAEGRAEYRDAVRRRDEAAQVHADRLIANTTYESAVAEAEIAAATVQRLEAAYDRQAEIVDRHTVRAPFPGIVAEKHAEAGQWLQRSDALLELVDTDVLRMDVPVPQNRFTIVTEGTPATVRFDALPDQPIEARVTTRVPISDPAARTFLARIEIDNADLRFAPGMSARVELRPGNSQLNPVLNVPRDALTRLGDGRHQVWVVETNGDGTQVRPVAVEVQRFAGGVAVITAGSIQAGAQLVVRGNERLQPGQLVSIVEPTS